MLKLKLKLKMKLEVKKSLNSSVNGIEREIVGLLRTPLEREMNYWVCVCLLIRGYNGTGLEDHSR